MRTQKQVVDEQHIARLKASKQHFLTHTSKRAMETGGRWAREMAEYAELRRIAETWPQLETTATDDAFGPLGVLVGVIRDDEFGGRSDVEAFFENLGDWVAKEDFCNPSFWDDFGEGALEVFREFEQGTD